MFLFASLIAVSVAQSSTDPDTLGVYLANKFTSTINTTQSLCAPTCPYARMAHVKTHGCLAATLTLNANIPTQFAFGLFDAATQGKTTFQALVRFSNGRGNGFTTGGPTADDSSADVRGMAVKVLGVQGTKLLQPTAETFDFLAVTSETNFMASLDDAQPYFDAVGENSTLAFAGWALAHPITAAHLIGFANTGKGYELTQHTFWPIAPLSFNGVAAKFRFQPNANPATSPLDTDSTNYLSYNLQTYFVDMNQAAQWTVSAQLYVDDTSTPIEDTSVQWQAPWVDLGVLSIAPQDVWSSPTQTQMCEEVSFNPWQVHTLNSPMGGLQTVRQHVYTQEAQVRHSWMQQMLTDWTSATLTSYVNAATVIESTTTAIASTTVATQTSVAPEGTTVATQTSVAPEGTTAAGAASTAVPATTTATGELRVGASKTLAADAARPFVASIVALVLAILTAFLA